MREIVVYVDGALKNGATEQEIVEALGVAVAVKAGSALIYSTRDGCGESKV